MVILNAKREALRILDEQTLNVIAHSIFPRVPDADIQRERGRGNHHDKCAHRFEKDAVSHLASTLHPAPRAASEISSADKLSPPASWPR